MLPCPFAARDEIRKKLSRWLEGGEHGRSGVGGVGERGVSKPRDFTDTGREYTGFRGGPGGTTTRQRLLDPNPKNLDRSGIRSPWALATRRNENQRDSPSTVDSWRFGHGHRERGDDHRSPWRVARIHS